MEARFEPDQKRPNEWRLAAAAIIVGLVVVVASLLANDGGISTMVKFGDEGAAGDITAYADSVAGQEYARTSPLGHDGQFFYLQALDPLYLGDRTHASHVDRPVYRGQRMLYPLAAGGGGLVPADLLPWTMTLTNLVAIALGTVGTGRLARRSGASAWWGLAFALNIGVMAEFDISGAGILAFAAAIWGTLALEEGRNRSAAAWFTAAVLAREVMFLYLAGALLLWLWRHRRIPWAIGLPPTIAAASWAVYLRLRLVEGTGVDEVQEFGAPFVGAAQAFENWIRNPLDLTFILAIVVIAPLLIVRAVKAPTYLSWGSLGFLVLAVFLSRQVLWRYFDITRAIAPVFTAYVVASFATRGTGDAGAADPDPIDLSESTSRPPAAVAPV